MPRKGQLKYVGPRRMWGGMFFTEEQIVKYRVKNNKYAKEHRELCRRGSAAYHQRQRDAVFAHYGEVCECCGEHRRPFLTIDHIHGGGKRHRKSLKAGGIGTSFYRWLVLNSFPKGYRTLCMNCNFATGHIGYCPHQKETLNG